MEAKTPKVMNTRYIRKQTVVPLYRKTKSLFNWLAKVTGVEACWIEGTDEHNRPVWGLIKRITANRFLVKSRRLATASIMGAALCLSGPSANAQSTVEASTFRGQNGFTVTGSAYADNLGRSLAVGDINGDGFEDLIVGAPGPIVLNGYVHIVSGRDGSILTTSPATQPTPSVSLYSWPFEAINCIPTQIPKKGRPFCSTASTIA